MAEHKAEQRRDEGFTLVEIIVALGVFLVVTMALLPQMVTGIRSVTTADHETVLKGILQQEVDRLRGLPYRVSLGSDGTGTDEDVDLLDLYYPRISTKAPAAVTCTDSRGFTRPTETWEGYVDTADAGRRCSYEPRVGVFYRTVDAMTVPRLGAVHVVRDVQFLSSGTTTSPTPAAATPRTGYDSDRAVSNYPPSSQVGVTVTVLYDDGGTTKARTLFTQISRRDQGPTLVRTSVDVTSVEITSVSADGAAQSLSSGVVDLEGAVGDISSASASLAGVVASTSTGDSTSSTLEYGATYAAAAPPAPASFVPVTDTPTWGGQACQEDLCWGSSSVTSDAGAGVSADEGLPTAGSTSSPLRAALTDTGSAALTFDNRDAQVAGAPLVRLLGVAPDAPAVATPTDCPLGSGTGRVSGAGYLRTMLDPSSDSVRNTAACASARSATIGILPKPWAPEGIVKVTLNWAYAWCTVTKGVPAGDAVLDATVQLADGVDDYGPAQPVSVVSLDTEIPGRGPLSTWFDSWTVGTKEQTLDPAVGEVREVMPGLTVTTKPTRMLPPVPTDPDGPARPDEQSAVITTLGAVSCSSVSAS